MDLHPNAQIVLRGFQAFADGDMATLKGLFHDDAAWRVSGRNRWAGEYGGVDSILRFFGDISAEAAIENQPHATLADDEHVVVLVNGRLSRGDEALDTQTVYIFHVSEGKVTDVWSTALDQHAVDEFWG